MVSADPGRQPMRHVSEVTLGLAALPMGIVVIHPTTVPINHVKVHSEAVIHHRQSARTDYAVPSPR